VALCPLARRIGSARDGLNRTRNRACLFFFLARLAELLVLLAQIVQPSAPRFLDLLSTRSPKGRRRASRLGDWQHCRNQSKPVPRRRTNWRQQKPFPHHLLTYSSSARGFRHDTSQSMSISLRSNSCSSSISADGDHEQLDLARPGAPRGQTQALLGARLAYMCSRSSPGAHSGPWPRAFAPSARVPGCRPS